MKLIKKIFFIIIFLFLNVNAFAAPTFVNDYQPEAEMNHVTGVVFNPTGTKMYVLGFHTSDKSYVSEVPLSVPFSTQSAGTPVLQEITTATKRAQDLKFNSDGTKLFILTTKAANNKDGIHVFTLSTPYDTSNLESDADAGNQTFIQFGSDPRGLDFNSDGTKMYVLQSASQVLEQYNLSTPFDPSTRNSNPITMSSLKGDRLHQGFGFSSDGYKMFIVKAQRVTGAVTNIIEDYNLTTPFEINTATLNETDNGIYTSVTDDASTDERIAGITFNFSQGANKLYYTDFHESDLVREFDLPCAYGIITCIDPTKNKDDVASVESQSTAVKQLIQHTTYPVLNRMEWLRRNKDISNLTSQNLKFQFSNEVLNSLTKSLIPIYFSNDNSLELKDQNKNWSFWSEGTISIGKIGDTSSSSSKDINTSAITFGADRIGRNNIMRGMALRLGNDDVDVGNLGSALDMSALSFTLYETRPHGDNKFIDSLIGISLINSDLINNSGSVSSTGKRDGKQIYGSFNFRETFTKDNLNITPKFKLNYGLTHLSNYSELGAEGLNLKFGNQTIGTIIGSLGSSFDSSYEFETGKFVPYFDFEYSADVSPTSEQEFSYASDGTKYILDNINNSLHNINSGVGFDFITDNGFTLMTKYTRNQTINSEYSDSFILAGDFKTKKKSFYTMSLQNNTTEISYKKELDNFYIDINSNYDFFKTNPDYGLYLKITNIN